MTPDALIVLGMHRAGTSTLTRGLQALGVELGDNLVGADEDNPKGYWEDSSVLKLNERVLDALGIKWHSVGPAKPSAWLSPGLTKLRMEAAALIREAFGPSALWGVKDPRFCRLLDFWQPVFHDEGIDEGYVIVVRNPLSVAKSLWNRNGFALEKSCLLWLQHFIPALGQTHGRPRVVVDFDELMEEPAFQLERIAKYLNVPVDDSTARSIAQFSSEFVDNKLRHSRFTPDDLKADERVSRLLHAVYECLIELAHDKIEVTSSELIPIWAEFQKELDDIGAFSSYIDSLESRPGLPAQLLTQLYVDTGNGFSETESILRGISTTTSELAFRFNAKYPNRIRFDPANTYVTTRLHKISLICSDSSSHEVVHYGTNGLRCNGRLLFDSKDPFLVWTVPKGPDISGCVVSISYELFGYEAVIETLKTKLGTSKARLERAHSELGRIMRSRAGHTIVRRALKEFFRGSPLRALHYYSAARTIIDSGLFDYSFYLDQTSGLDLPHLHPLVHFLDRGAMEGCSPHPLFDTPYYLAMNSGVAESRMNPLVHFLKIGALKSYDPHPLFSTSYYLENNPNAKRSGLNPLVYFLKYGASEGFNPHPLFDTKYYLANNPDVARLGINPLVHFIEHGAAEGRASHP